MFKITLKDIQPVKKKLSDNESKLQQHCVKWFDIQYANRWTRFIEITSNKKGIKIPKLVRVSALIMLANGFNRSKSAAGRAVAEGLSTGAADLLLAVPQSYFKAGDIHKYAGIFIEMKYAKNKQSIAQVEFQNLIQKAGYRYELVYDFDSFKSLIENHLGK
jgi:hypothetical protein